MLKLPPDRLFELIDWSSHDPQAVAVITEGRPISYSQFRVHVTQVRAWLATRLGQADRRLGIIFKHEYSNWVAHLAAWELGRQVLSLRGVDTARVVQALGVDWVICDKAQSDRFLPHKVLVLDLDLKGSPNTVFPNQGWDNQPEMRQSCDDRWSKSEAMVPARVVLTSGTTGASRSVLWPESMTLARVSQLQQSLQMNRGTRLYAFQHIGTTGGFRYPLACWRSGGTVLLRGGDVGFEATWAVLESSNLLVLAPTNLRTLIQQWPQSWPGCDERHVVLAGGRMPRNLLDMALRHVARSVSLAYGSTETGAVATGDAGLIGRHPGAVGFVRPGVEVQIVDTQDQPLPPDTVGIVRIKTPYMVRNYEPLAHQGHAGAEVFRDGWFYPGDRGILGADRFLSIEGRTGDVVNVGGAKLSLGDLEQKLEGLSGVRDLCVLLLPLPDGDRLGVMMVADESTSDSTLHKAIQAVLKPRTPYTLVRTRQIERNAMGKVARTQLAQKIMDLMAHRGQHEKSRLS